MAFTHKDGRGRVFPNDQWEGGVGETRPKWKGNGMVGGVVWRIAVWEQENGDLTLSFEEPREQREKQERLPIKKPILIKRNLDDELDDEIPW